MMPRTSEEQSAYNRKYYQEHKDKILEQKRNNKDREAYNAKMREYLKEYRKQNGEKLNARARERRAANREEYNAKYREYQRKYRAKRKEQKLLENPDYEFKVGRKATLTPEERKEHAREAAKRHYEKHKQEYKNRYQQKKRRKADEEKERKLSRFVVQRPWNKILWELKQRIINNMPEEIRQKQLEEANARIAEREQARAALEEKRLEFKRKEEEFMKRHEELDNNNTGDYSVSAAPDPDSHAYYLMMRDRLDGIIESIGEGTSYVDDKGKEQSYAYYLSVRDRIKIVAAETNETIQQQRRDKAEKHRASNKKYYQEHKDKILEQRRNKREREAFVAAETNETE